MKTPRSKLRGYQKEDNPEPARSKLRGIAPKEIELDEGVRVVSHVIDLDMADLRIGLPVEVVFEDVTPNTTLHKFRPASPAP